jgi:hypothetical protein
MFTATITKKSFAEGVMQVVVEFSNGTITFTRAFNINSADDLKRQVRNEITRLNELAELATTLPDGSYTPTETTPPAPTQAVLDKQEWFPDFTRLERVQELVTLGVLTGTETAVVALRNKVKTNFKPAYIADM